MHNQPLSREADSASDSTDRRLASPRRSPWIVDPVFDMLFVAGGLPIILIAANVFSTGWNLPTPFAVSKNQTSGLLLGLVLIGQHLFANSHNIATYLRIWGSEEDRGRFYFYRTWLVAFFIPFFIWGLFSPAATGAFVYLFLMAVFWHYAAQSYGVALIYCYKRNYFLRPVEKRLMKLCMTSLSAFAILRLASFRNFSPYEWYGVPMPFWGPFSPIFFQIAAILFSICSIAFCLLIVGKLIFEKQLFPLPSLMVLIAVGTLGLSESSTNAMLWFYIPPFFHGTQYLAISLAYSLKERGAVGPMSLSKLFGSPTAARLFATTVVVGAFLYVVIPHIFEQFGFNYAMVAGLILAIVNFHHFLTDAAIWKLRDPRCREILLGVTVLLGALRRNIAFAGYNRRRPNDSEGLATLGAYSFTIEQGPRNSYRPHLNSPHEPYYKSYSWQPPSTSGNHMRNEKTLRIGFWVIFACAVVYFAAALGDHPLGTTDYDGPRSVFGVGDWLRSNYGRMCLPVVLLSAICGVGMALEKKKRSHKQHHSK